MFPTEKKPWGALCHEHNIAMVVLVVVVVVAIVVEELGEEIGGHLV